MSFLILRLFILKYHISLGIVNCPQDEDICITIKIQTMHSFYLSWDRNQFRFPILPWQPEPVPLSYTSLATGTSSAFPLSWQPEPVPLHSDHHKNRPKMALSSSSMAPKCRTASLPLSPTGLRYESEMHWFIKAGIGRTPKPSIALTFSWQSQEISHFLYNRKLDTKTQIINFKGHENLLTTDKSLSFHVSYNR